MFLVREFRCFARMQIVTDRNFKFFCDAIIDLLHLRHWNFLRYCAVLVDGLPAICSIAFEKTALRSFSSFVYFRSKWTKRWYRLLYQGEFFYAKRCVHAYMEPCRPVVLTALFLCSQGSKDRLGFVPKESKTRNSTANSANLYSIDGFSRCTPRGLFARGATVSARKSRRPGKNQSPAGYVPGIRSERPVIFIASTNTMPLLVIQRQLFGKQF